MIHVPVIHARFSILCAAKRKIHDKSGRSKRTRAEKQESRTDGGVALPCGQLARVSPRSEVTPANHANTILGCTVHLVRTSGLPRDLARFQIYVRRGSTDSPTHLPWLRTCLPEVPIRQARVPVGRTSEAFRITRSFAAIFVTSWQRSRGWTRALYARSLSWIALLCKPSTWTFFADTLAPLVQPRRIHTPARNHLPRRNLVGGQHHKRFRQLHQVLEFHKPSCFIRHHFRLRRWGLAPSRCRQ